MGSRPSPERRVGPAESPPASQPTTLTGSIPHGWSGERNGHPQARSAAGRLFNLDRFARDPRSAAAPSRRGSAGPGATRCLMPKSYARSDHGRGIESDDRACDSLIVNHHALVETSSRPFRQVSCLDGRLAQLVRAPRLHRGSHWFESSTAHQVRRTKWPLRPSGLDGGGTCC